MAGDSWWLKEANYFNTHVTRLGTKEDYRDVLVHIKRDGYIKGILTDPLDDHPANYRVGHYPILAFTELELAVRQFVLYDDIDTLANYLIEHTTKQQRKHLLKRLAGS